MSDHIKVTCEHCNHIIKAPRSAAGRRGKCPHCKNSVYVPTPPEEIEEIPLAPIDDRDEVRAEKLDKENFELTQALLQEADDDASGRDQGPRAPAPEPAPAQPAVSITDQVVSYLLAMRDSDLDKASHLVLELRKSRAQTRSKVQQMMVDAMPPEAVRDIPDGLYQGFLRKLLDELS